jgi:hypothetical protein
MAIGKQPHDLTGPPAQLPLVACDPETFLHRTPRIQRMAEPSTGLGHRDVRCRGGAVLAGPGIEGREQDAMDRQEIVVADHATLRQVGDRLVEPRAEELVLEFLDDLRIRLAVSVAQVAGLREVLKRIEHPACAPAGS